jgi:hypothetical protein
LWGVLAGLTSPRIGIAVAGVLILATPALLPRVPLGSFHDTAQELRQ